MLRGFGLVLLVCGAGGAPAPAPAQLAGTSEFPSSLQPFLSRRAPAAAEAEAAPPAKSGITQQQVAAAAGTPMGEALEAAVKNQKLRDFLLSRRVDHHQGVDPRDEAERAAAKKKKQSNNANKRGGGDNKAPKRKLSLRAEEQKFLQLARKTRTRTLVLTAKQRAAYEMWEVRPPLPPPPTRLLTAPPPSSLLSLSLVCTPPSHAATPPPPPTTTTTLALSSCPLRCRHHTSHARTRALSVLRTLPHPATVPPPPCHPHSPATTRAGANAARRLRSIPSRHPDSLPGGDGYGAARLRHQDGHREQGEQGHAHHQGEQGREQGRSGGGGARGGARQRQLHGLYAARASLKPSGRNQQMTSRCARPIDDRTVLTRPSHSRPALIAGQGVMATCRSTRTRRGATGARCYPKMGSPTGPRSARGTVRRVLPRRAPGP